MTGEVLFTAGPYRAFTLNAGDVARLQRFYEANPGYHLLVNGEPPGADEARKDLDDLPPPGWPYDKRWLLGIVDEGDAMVAVADVTANLLAAGVWHIGLFMVATSLHGSGAAKAIYDALEAWMRDGGARWLRIGVVEANAPGMRFWEKAGYLGVRSRHDVAMGRRTHTVRLMAKPLANGRLPEYLGMVPRDRPDAP